MMWKLFYLFSLAVQAQEEVDLDAASTDKTYPYYDPFVRHPAYLILPLLTLILIAVHLLRTTKPKPLSGRKPDIFFYPETEKTNEKQK